MEVYVKTVDLEKLFDKMNKSRDIVKDMSPFWRTAGDRIKRKSMECFRKEQDPEGRPWKPWSPAYRALVLSGQMRPKGKKKHLSHKILQDTGELRRSINTRVFRDRVIIGSNLEYADKHQLGLGVPARPFIGVTRDDMTFIRKKLKQYLKLEGT